MKRKILLKTQNYKNQPKPYKPYNIQRFLEQKYSQSKTYYYTKSLNDFVKNARTSQVITFYWTLNYHNLDDVIVKRFYSKGEASEKMVLLVEYYKYHNEIPRFFMPKLSDQLSNYHDRRRRIEYFRIKRMIEEENRLNPEKPKKGIVGDQIEESSMQRSKKQKYSNVLADLSEVSATIELLTKKLNCLRSNVGELQIQPSMREQDGLQDFLSFLSDQKRVKTQIQPPQSARHAQMLTKQTTMGSRQVGSRKLLSKQPNQAIVSVSPRQNIKDLIAQQIQGSQTQRASQHFNNLQLNKMLSSPTSLHKPKASTTTTKSSYSLTKQFRLSEVIRMPIKLHQHTRSEYKFIRK